MTMRMAIATVFLMTPHVLRADGGKVVSSQRQDDLLITVFLAPTPVRAGTVDISVLVQDVEAGRIVEPRRVLVRRRPAHRNEPPITRQATHEAATNKLLTAATIELPTPGEWDISVLVTTDDGAHESAFLVTAAEPLPRLVELAGWLLWPLLPIGLFLLREARRLRTRPAINATEAERDGG